MNLAIDDPLFYRLTFERLFRRTLLVLRRGGSTILTVCVIILLPGFLLQLLARSYGWAIGIGIDSVNVLVNLVLSPLATGALVYSVFRLLREQPMPTVSHSLSLAGSQILKLVVASLLAGILAAIGLMACIVPGLIAMAGLLLVAPAIMVEKVGPIEALNRSWELSEGYRWPIFSMVLLTWLLQVGFLYGVDGFLVVTGLPNQLSLYSPHAYDFVITAIDMVITVIVTAISAATAGVAYHDLRLSKEELGEDELLAVFE